MVFVRIKPWMTKRQHVFHVKHENKETILRVLLFFTKFSCLTWNIIESRIICSKLIKILEHFLLFHVRHENRTTIWSVLASVAGFCLRNFSCLTWKIIKETFDCLLNDLQSSCVDCKSPSTNNTKVSLMIFHVKHEKFLKRKPATEARTLQIFHVYKNMT